MESKTATTILLVLVCLLLFPLAIGLIGGLFGVLGSIIGGIFGLIGSLFGAIFGIIGGIFGAVFGFFGWLFGMPFDCGSYWPGSFFGSDVFTVLAIILVVVVLSRSRAIRTGK